MRDGGELYVVWTGYPHHLAIGVHDDAVITAELERLAAAEGRQLGYTANDDFGHYIVLLPPAPRV
jgi:hypothetical protein